MSATVAARVRFAAFGLIVLGLPGGVMALGDPRLADLGKLALILSPAITGLALGRGLGHRGARVRWVSSLRRSPDRPWSSPSEWRGDFQLISPGGTFT